MRNLFLFCAFSLFCSQLSAQAMGNYWQQSQTIQMSPSASNTLMATPIEFNHDLSRENYATPQFRSLPKNATIIGDNILEISINALSNVPADSYVAIFNLVQIGKTADETNTLMGTRINGFVNSLKAMGVPETDIYIDMVNFMPKYEYDITKKLFSKKNYTEIPKGFEMQKNVHVRYKRANMLDGIVSAAAKNEVFDIVKVDYFVNDPQSVYLDLRKKTIEYLNSVEKLYKDMLPLDSAYNITAENAWVAYPPNRYESYQVFCTQNLDVDKSAVVINNVDKPVSRFYNAVPGNDYDIVINAEILEPAVQFSYNLIVRYTLPERIPYQQQVNRTQFMMITPTGDVRTLKIE
jgi:uncharacterized protein YggE